MSAAAPGAGLAALFGGLSAARNRAFDHGWLRIERLAAPVISVGNLSVGGTGKTPAVVALGRELARRGIRYDVLTRGYRRAGGGALRVLAPNGAEADAAAGDEPRLIAQQLGVPVLVSADRVASGREGERRFASQLHLLDDGFQRRQLARCFDLVLVTPQDLQDRLLPAGRLRESPRALARASAVLWVAPEGGEAAQAQARQQLARWTPAPVYFGYKQPRKPALAPATPVFAFCALGQPDSFWQTLEELQLRIVGRRSFRDHHRYRRAELARLARDARAAAAQALATTAKDAWNLPVDHNLERLEIIHLDLHIAGLPRLADAMLAAAGLPHPAEGGGAG
ncbi:MAG: tetraacyldisaccharide 4'-kinase [Terriglobales bacterium]